MIHQEVISGLLSLQAVMIRRRSQESTSASLLGLRAPIATVELDRSPQASDAQRGAPNDDGSNAKEALEGPPEENDRRGE